MKENYFIKNIALFQDNGATIATWDEFQSANRMHSLLCLTNVSSLDQCSSLGLKNSLVGQSDVMNTLDMLESEVVVLLVASVRRNCHGERRTKLCVKKTSLQQSPVT